MSHGYGSRENYGQVVRAKFDYLVNGVAADLPRIARRAYAEELITKPALQNATNPATNESDRATGLVSAIQQKIGISHEAFGVFLGILREEPVVSEMADTLEKDLLNLEKHTAPKRPSRGDGAKGQRGEREGGADGKKAGASTRENNSRVAGLSNTSLSSVAGNGSVGVPLEAVEHLAGPDISPQQATDDGGSSTNTRTELHIPPNEKTAETQPRRRRKDGLQQKAEEAEPQKSHSVFTYKVLLGFLLFVVLFLLIAYAKFS